jgi:nitrite reductase (NADH) small subunit
MSEFITVAKTNEIPVGEGKAFEVHDQLVAVFNTGDQAGNPSDNESSDQFLAIDDMCPHMGASLATGHFNATDCTVTCPWHAWRFDVKDGTWCDNRRLKIDTFQVRVVGDEIQVAPVAPVAPVEKPDAE